MGQKKISDLNHLDEITNDRLNGGWQGPVFPLELSFLAATRMMDFNTETTDEQMTTIKVNLNELLFLIFEMLYKALTNDPLLEHFGEEITYLQDAAAAFKDCVTEVLNSTQNQGGTETK